MSTPALLQAITRGAEQEAEWKKACEEYKAKYPKVGTRVFTRVCRRWMLHMY